MNVTIPRGIRLNNPGNIRLSKIRWLGQVAMSAQDDPDYVRYIEPVYGIRAIAKIFHSYAARGILSISGIIHSWAPPTENDTDSYVKDVLIFMNTGHDVSIVGANTLVDSRNLTLLLVPAIIHHEQGVQPYAADLIQHAIDLAEDVV